MYVCFILSVLLSLSFCLYLSVCSNETMEPVQVHSIAAMHKSRLEDSVVASSVIFAGEPVTSSNLTSEVRQAISMNCRDFTSLLPPTINFYLIYWCSHSGHIWLIHFKRLIKYSLVLALSWAQKKLKKDMKGFLFSVFIESTWTWCPKQTSCDSKKAMPNTLPPAPQMMSLRGKKKKK